MPSPLTPGSSIIVTVQYLDADMRLRRKPTGSTLPVIPQSVSRGGSISGLLWFATATACQIACPPCTDQAGIHPQPPGTFTTRLPTGRSPFPPLDMTTTATGLLCRRAFTPLEWQLVF